MSIVLVGMTAFLSRPTRATGDHSDPLVGVVFILCAAFVQSLQYVIEEYVMSETSLVNVPPMLLIGVEGFWGTLICFFIIYPLAYLIKGNDHGSLENPFNTLTILLNSSHIQMIFVLYMASVLAYNILAVTVTYMLDSVWHGILDNFRPIAVWSIGLVIYYGHSREFGESWTMYCWLQLLGLAVLLYGTAIYNAPNPGSIKLTGGCWSCGVDCSDEYSRLADEHDDKKDDETPLRFQVDDQIHSSKSLHAPDSSVVSNTSQYGSLTLV
jgi:hypothetical protein